MTKSLNQLLNRGYRVYNLRSQVLCVLVNWNTSAEQNWMQSLCTCTYLVVLPADCKDERMCFSSDGHDTAGAVLALLLATTSHRRQQLEKWRQAQVSSTLTTICFILVGRMCLMGSYHTPHNSGCRSGDSFGHIPCRWLPISSAAILINLINIAQHMGSPRSQLNLKRTTVMGKFLIWLIPMPILILIPKSPD